MLPHHHFGFIDKCRQAYHEAVRIFKEDYPNHHYHPREGRHLGITHIVFPNNQKIGGLIMNFSLSKDTPSLRIIVQPLDENNNILPETDVVTQHPTIKPNSLTVVGDDNVAVSADPTDATVFVITRKSNTFTGEGVLTLKAKNDLDEDITGEGVITIIADPAVDNGIAKSLQIALAPADQPAGDGGAAGTADGSAQQEG